MRHGLQSLRMKRHLLYRASFRAKRLRRVGFGHSNAVGISSAKWRDDFLRGGDWQAGLQKSHFGCQDSLSEPSLQWPEHKDPRRTGPDRHQYSFPKRNHKTVCAVMSAREFRGSQDQILSASHSPPSPPLYFQIVPSIWILKKKNFL